MAVHERLCVGLLLLLLLLLVTANVTDRTYVDELLLESLQALYY